MALFPLVSKEDILKGEAAYANSCRYCHGLPETGNLPVFKPLRNSDIVKGDPQVLADAILFSPHHRKGSDGPYLFEKVDDETIVHIGNYVRDKAEALETPMRVKTVERAREAHASATAEGADSAAQ